MRFHKDILIKNVAIYVCKKIENLLKVFALCNLVQSCITKKVENKLEFKLVTLYLCLMQKESSFSLSKHIG